MFERDNETIFNTFYLGGKGGGGLGGGGEDYVF